MKSWYPQGYEAPKPASGYMKLQAGINHIRILTQPIVGWEDWTPDRKPVRFKMGQQPKTSLDPERPMKHFLAFVVWNYQEAAIQILHITQSTIRNKLDVLCNDEDWGNPTGYDIKIHKEGEKTDTRYEVSPTPHKSVKPEIVAAFRAKPIWLEALYSGGDPFTPNRSSLITPLFEEESEGQAVSLTESKEMDIEFFMDFMPSDATRETVEKFATLCATRSKLPLEAYLAQIAESDDSLENFTRAYLKWIVKMASDSKKSA